MISLGLMVRSLCVAVACLSCACASTSDGSAPSSQVIETVAVFDAGLVGEFCRPSGRQRLPGIVVVGGSEGGIEGARGLARLLAEAGYATLALAFFGAEGLPQHLQHVPLSYFDRAIDWMAARDDVDAQRIGLIGGSKGAEAVLLVAAHRTDLAAVVAAAPSDVVWQGINRDDATPRSSWLSSNGPAPYVPFDRSEPFTTVHDLYRRSRARYGENTEAIIPVEHIEAPLLLLAGDEDGLWDSAEMSRHITERLTAYNSGHAFRYVEFRRAGHDVLGPPVSRDRAAALNEDGGDTDGNFNARRRAWPIILSWFDEALKR